MNVLAAHVFIVHVQMKYMVINVFVIQDGLEIIVPKIQFIQVTLFFYSSSSAVVSDCIQVRSFVIQVLTI